MQRPCLYLQIFFTHDEEEVENRIKLVDSLKTALRTQPMSFVLRFLELNGLECLLDFLSSMDYATAHSAIHTSVLACIKALMNSSEGRSHVLAHPNGLDIVAQSLAMGSVRTKVLVLEMLGAVCLVPGGHRKVLDAFVHFQKYSAERTRFQTLINELDTTTDQYQDEVSLKTAIMSFINAALKYGPGQTQLEFRLHLRYEFLMLGIQPIIEKLRTHDNATLNRHLDFFEMVRAEDDKELAKKFDMSHVDTRSATAMFDLLRKKLSHSVAYQHVLSVLFHFLQLPCGNGPATIQHWQLIDRMVQQISLQTKGSDPDQRPLSIDVKKMIKQLASENTMKEVSQKMRELHRESDDLAAKLAKKQRECEIKAEEKEELMATLTKIKAKLDKETAGHIDTKAHINDLNQQLSDLSQLVDMERAERLRLEHAVKTGSLPDDAKAGCFGSNETHCTGVPPPPPPPPCIPPPPGGGPPGPPPPPGMAPSIAASISSLPKKNTPKSSQPLKSFNWAKLPENKVKETVWSDLDDTKLYKNLDLDEFEKTFSAYQRPPEDSQENLKSTSAKSSELSVIDGRRAQNCTILLSKLRMSNAELVKAIEKVDAEEEIPKDMCEQLLRYVPSPEEAQMLSEHAHEMEQMARADRFLFEMTRISHYEQKLTAIYYKKKFSERMADAKPKVEAVLEASKEIQKSRRLKRLLEIVLAFGNYMNKGHRGNAFGFRLNSLNKIVDTKSSLDRKVTLLHYLSDVVEKKFPDLTKLSHDIQHVHPAAKVNLTELENDMKTLRIGLKDIEQEVQHQKSTDSCSTKFISVMSDFLSVATYNFSELDDQFKDAKEKYEQVVKQFGEDPRSIQPEEFFGIFDLFLASFSEAKKDNERFKRQKLEEEKRNALMEAKMKMEKEKSKLRVNGESGEKKRKKAQGEKEEGEFDDLISALRTGDVFGEDMAKLKRTRRKPSLPKQASVETVRERVGPKA
ncbi:hypothetical protein CAPTEDRAFT_175180 [Capitella teleta]|uniref:FH2 domain-containing protein n=1 Tax=Capitella teleta TaxID=283909 RepID=R7TJ79_CAPTE|nr:hypothetical protein CAPTEDRAFT_175180 [Capitella teleta]|eukprot:ELT93552.1 hypothetical protein CAPTEDRAFT_175180 [Capitella teleta]